MEPFRPERIYIDPEAQEKALTRQVLSRLPGVPVEYIEGKEKILSGSAFLEDALTEGKKKLFITLQKGTFFKSCPGCIERMVHCNYYILNLGSNCHMECTYCFLQGYINNPFLVLYANLDDMMAEVSALFSQYPKRFYRIGTGELMDSLALDGLTQTSRILIPFFTQWENVLLELKTKTNQVDNLLDLDPRGRVVVSWSLNPEAIIETQEFKTSSLEERLLAAWKCQEAGYRIGLHFDPLIYYPEWEKDYQELLNQIFSRINSRTIAWISLGSLRFTPELKRIIRKRFPQSKILFEEFAPGVDGKMRYLKPIRVYMYLKMLEWIQRYDAKLTPYLCMESQEVWHRVFLGTEGRKR
jgi:spore photoproduct lyase